MAESASSPIAASPLSRPVALPRQPSTSAVRSKVPLPVVLLLLALVLPPAVALPLGGLHLPAHRLLLIALLPLAFIEMGKRGIRLALPDYCILAFATMQAVSLIIHHGLTDNITLVYRDYVTTTSSLVNGGVTFLETVSPYLIARAYIRTSEQFIAVCRLLVYIALAVGLFTVIESISGYSVFQTRTNNDFGGMRYGYVRAAGPFPHAIVWGLFAASVFPFALLGATAGKNNAGRLVTAMLVLGAAFTSVSSAALGAIGIQIILILWLVYSAGLKQRWLYFALGCVLAYTFVEVMSNRSAVQVFFNYTALNAWTGYYRTLIWEFGWQNFLASPLFGIGFNDWARPSWMSASVDAFWLVILMRYGIFAAIPLAGAFAIALFRVEKAIPSQKVLSSKSLNIGYWWMASLVSLIVAAFTVHLWGQIFVYFFFLLGLWGALTHSKTRRPTRHSSTSQDKRF